MPPPSVPSPASPAPSDAFRTDIEGLRAFAILPILIFHLDPAWMPGGFIGVDIFFVISGFLISGQILKASPGTFRFLPFYLRRIRRLFPALAVTVAVSLAVGWRLFTPGDFKALAWSALASLAGIANIHFYASVDYFNASTLLHPLLHVWSLSVEEQFYLLWPALLVLLLARGRRSLIAGIAVIGLLSFAASAVVTFKAPYLTFYMMPFRIFEFAIGALVCIHAIRLNPMQALLCGFAGVALLALCLVSFSAATPWPGTHALIPCLATALLLIAGRSGFWHRLLSLAPLRMIGRISYSVYLVHWPLIVFYRYWALVPPSPRELAALFVLSLVLGGLLYVLVERFYRASPEPKVAWLFVGTDAIRTAGAALESLIAKRQAAIFSIFLLLPLAAAGSSAAVILRDGFPERMKKGRVQAAGELSFAGDLCNSARDRCAFGDPSSSRIVYLIGDSHALNLVYGLDLLFRESGIRGIAFYDHGCLFLKGTQRFDRGVPDRQCARNVAAAFDAVVRDHHPVIIAGSYGGYVKGIGPADSDRPYEGTGADYFAWLGRHFRDSLHAIDATNRPVVLFSASYNTRVDTARCALQFGEDDARCAPASPQQARQDAEATDSMIAALRNDFPALAILDPKTPFCKGESCVVRAGGRPYFRDTAHLTNEGSAFLIARLKDELLAALTPKP